MRSYITVYFKNMTAFVSLNLIALQIVIDGVPVSSPSGSSVGLRRLRRTLTIIPQQPVVRKNKIK